MIEVMTSKFHLPSESREMKKVFVALTALALTMGIAPSSKAAQSLQLSPVTDLNPAGDIVHVGFTTFPTGKDFYFYQAVKPVAGSRPTIKSGDQIWVSNSKGAKSPNGDLGVNVKALFDTADCSKDICGIFVRYGHESGGEVNTSEDQFFPITFKAGAVAPALPSDAITATIDGVAISGQAPGVLAYRTPKTIVVNTTSGEAVTITSSTPDCTATGKVIEALKGVGGCDFEITSNGNSSYAKKSLHFPFTLALGIQNISTKATSLKIGKSAALAGITNFGEKVTYTTSSKNCSVKGAKVTALKAGICAVTASAPAAANYGALSSTINIKVSK